MKLKYYTLIVVLVAMTSLAGAQCVPDQNITNPGFYPDEFAIAHKDEPYQHIFQVRIMADTQVNFLGEWKTAYVDSIRINDMWNLPSGFVFTCNDPACMFTPDKTGCITVSGNPTEGNVGEYFVDIEFTVWARVDGTIPVIQDNTIEDKRLVVSQYSSAVIDLSLLKPVLSPNPSSDGIFTVTGIPSNDLTGEVYDAKGSLVAKLAVENGQLDCSSYQQGLYFVKLLGADGVVAYQKVRIQ